MVVASLLPLLASLTLPKTAPEAIDEPDLVPVTGAADTGPVDPLEALERRQMELCDQVTPSVVLISTSEGFGSGFFVSRDGLIVTSAHVVGKRGKVDVVTHDGRKFLGTVVERGSGVDLALVDVDIKNAPPLALAPTNALAVGRWVAAVGHGHGGVWTFNTGMISNIYPASASRPGIQTQIPLNPGASGGPIVDRRGRVVGVVTAGVTEGQNINFALRADSIARALPKVRKHCDCLAIEAPSGAPIFVDGNLVGKGPEVVLVVESGEYDVFALVAGKRRRARVRFPHSRSIDLVP